MSDLTITLNNGKVLSFNILEDGWLSGRLGETLLHVQQPYPDHTGRKPSHVYRPDEDLLYLEWMEVDRTLARHFAEQGLHDELFGFGKLIELADNKVTMYSHKTHKALQMTFVGNEIVDAIVTKRK